MAEGMAAGELVGAGGVEEIPGERALLRSVDVAAIVQGERFPARARIRAPADVRHGVGLAVVPGGEILSHQLGVEPRAFDGGDVIALDPQPDGGFYVALEREVEISRREDERAVDAPRPGKREAQTPRPMRERSRLLCISPDASDRRSLDRDLKLGAGGGGDVHALGFL